VTGIGSGNTSYWQASPITEILTNDGNDLLFYGYGDNVHNPVGVLAAQNVTIGGGASNPTPYTLPNANGGSSGIVVDNISTAAQASSIYFATLGR